MHDRALGRADQVVVLDGPAVGVELLAGLEDDGVQPALGIGQLHPVADDERARHRLRAPTAPPGGRSASSAGSWCVSTGGQPTERAGCDPAVLARRGRSELSVGRPSLGPMTATVQTDRLSQAGRGGPGRRRRRRTRAPRRPSLSPSRAADFKTCPLLYRFRTIDRLPERKSLAAVRGTLVHSVLERLYDLPAAQRTVRPRRSCSSRPGPSSARSRASPSCSPSRRTTARRPRPSAPESVEAWLLSAGKLVEKYFTLEDPTPHPAARPRGTRRGHAARRAAAARLRRPARRRPERRAAGRRLQDRRVPREAFEGKALFQMKFYALVLWRTRGVVAAQLKLLYLRTATRSPTRPTRRSWSASSAPSLAIWAAIERAVATGDFRPNKTRLCDWCDHQALCPSFGRHSPAVPGRGRGGRRLADPAADRRAATDEGPRYPRASLRSARAPAAGPRAGRPTCTRTGHRRRSTANGCCPAVRSCSSTTVASPGSNRHRSRCPPAAPSPTCPTPRCSPV